MATLGQSHVALEPNKQADVHKSGTHIHTATHTHYTFTLICLYPSPTTYTHTLKESNVYARARGGLTTSKMERVAAGENCCSTSAWWDDIRGVGGRGVSGPEARGVAGSGQDERGRNGVDHGRLAPIINSPDVMDNGKWPGRRLGCDQGKFGNTFAWSYAFSPQLLK